MQKDRCWAVGLLVGLGCLGGWGGGWGVGEEKRGRDPSSQFDLKGLCAPKPCAGGGGGLPACHI